MAENGHSHTIGLDKTKQHEAGAAAFSISFNCMPTMEQLKDLYIERMLQAHGGNREAAARAMGISARNLYRHLAGKKAGQKAAAESALPFKEQRP